MSAASLRAAAARKDELAQRVDAQARDLPGLLDGVAARLGPDVWRGPAAEEFAAGVRRWRAALDAEAEALHGVARRLRAAAEALRDEARRVEAEAAAAAAAQERALAAAGGRVR